VRVAAVGPVRMAGPGRVAVAAIVTVVAGRLGAADVEVDEGTGGRLRHGSMVARPCCGRIRSCP
jgi:hypothetical protein